MKTRTLRRVLYVGAAFALLAACSDSSIQSPGEGQIGSPASPPPSSPPPSGSTASLVPAGGCPTGTRETNTTSGSTTVTVCELTGDIQANTEIPAGSTVVVSGPVTVGTDGGPTTAGGVSTAAPAVLTIGAGATVVGNSGSDYILVNRGSQIVANGTAANPIIFTSLADALATQSGSPRAAETDFSSEWGGIVINGRAPINACKVSTATGGTAGCEKDGEASTGVFGGGVPTDSSGTLQYVQVRYAGFRINGENELNGIAFQGVGSGTTVNYVQVHNNSDDGMEFFGGTVNAKHLVLTGNEDDSLDWTDGWTGKVQFVLVRHRGVGDNGFEMDNRGGSNDRLPRSNPTISNFTSIGRSTSSRGLLYREGTNGRLINGIVTGFPTCLDIDQASTYTNLSGDEFASLYFSCATPFDPDTGEPSDEQTVFTSQSPNNKTGQSTMTGVFPGANELAVPFTNPADGFFDTVSYIGAFGPTETETSSWASGWTFGVFDTQDADTCPTGTTDTNETLAGRKVCRLPSNVTSDLTLQAGLNYEMVGPVFIGADRGGNPASPLPSGIPAIVTIEAGATLFGSSGSDYIVVTRGSQLRSNGTPARPVIFTSRSDLAGTVGLNDRAQWGGLVLNGRAPINHCAASGTNGGDADCNKEGEGSSGLFGGNAPTDDSGNIFYSRVMYAGFRVNNENELNGIAFQGVGSGTEVDYVQVHNNADDGMEFFGGTVNAKHLVLTGNEDDSLDWTDGWTGKVQFVIIQHSNSGDNGFEMDNRGGSNDRLPRSSPIISNITAVGSSGSTGRAMLYREGTNGRLINGVFANFPTCLDIDHASTYANLTGNEFQSDYLSCATLFDPDTGEASDEAAVFNAGLNNKTGASTLSGFTFITGTPGVVPGANEKSVTAIDPSTIDPFFTSTNYVGAVKDASDGWFQGWTYRQQ